MAGPPTDSAAGASTDSRSRGASSDIPDLKFEDDDDGAAAASAANAANSAAVPDMKALPSLPRFQSPAVSAPGTQLTAGTPSSGPFTADYFMPKLHGDGDTPVDDLPMTDATLPADIVPKAESSPTTTLASSGTSKKPRLGGGPSTRGGGVGRGGTRGGNGGNGGTRGARSRGGRTRGGGRRGGKSRGSRGGGTVGRPPKSSSGTRKADSLTSTAGAGRGNPEGGDDADADAENDDEGLGDEDDYGGDDNDEGDEDDDEGGHGDDDVSDSGPYCICRGPDNHRWMIQCDRCEDWFHGDCVKINKEAGEHIIHSYICPNCTIPGRFTTRYRKLCSLPNCHKPARLYDVKDSAVAADPANASYFCSPAHRDQWWDSLMALMDRGGEAREGTASGGTAGTVSVAEMPVDQFTPTQLLTILATTDQAGVVQMLLHGLVQDSNIDPDALLTEEERTATRASEAERLRLHEQLAMCKRMLQMLDMAKARNYEAIKAGAMERDCCGYDDRLQHVGVQPHFERFLASPEGVAIFTAGALSAPPPPPPPSPTHDDERDANHDRMDTKDDSNGNDSGSRDDSEENGHAMTAGMCLKRKCKAHLSWLHTLARDVRMQMQNLTRQAAVLRNNETRIRRAAVQRSFVKQHISSEVRYALGSGHRSSEDGQQLSSLTTASSSNGDSSDDGGSGSGSGSSSSSSRSENEDQEGNKQSPQAPPSLPYNGYRHDQSQRTSTGI